MESSIYVQPFDIRIDKIIGEIETIKENMVFKQNIQQEVLRSLKVALRDSQNKPATNQLLRKILSGTGTESSNGDDLEQDFFSIMMLNKIISPAWVIGLIAFTIQITLGALVINEQTEQASFGSVLSIPIRSKAPHAVAQSFVIALSIMTQRDLLVGLRTIISFPYKDKERWSKIVKTEDRLNIGLWFRRVFMPNFLKMVQGFFILLATFILIIQSSETVDLLKDYSALFVISTIDDLFFSVAETGYFGSFLSKKTYEVKDVKIDKHEKNAKPWMVFVLPVIISITMTGFFYINAGQRNGRYVKQIHPFCPVDEIDLASSVLSGQNVNYLSQIGDGTCQYRKGEGTNIVECGWDGGDCLIFKDRYPGCINVVPSRLGDGNCDFGAYNTKECFFDGGDCVDLNNEVELEFPNCVSVDKTLAVDGLCNSLELFSWDCGFDGGACGDCNIDNLALVKSGFCDVPSMELIGENYKGFWNWGEAVLGEDGFVYAVPNNEAHILKIDPTTNSTSLVGDFVSGTWDTAVLGNDGCIYGIPTFGTDSILKYDPIVSKTTVVAKGHLLLKTVEGFYGGVLANNGKIYLIPYQYNKVVVFDPSNLKDPLLEIGEDLGNDGFKYVGGVLGKDGNIYAIPHNAKRVLKITVSDDTTSFLDAEYFGKMKWAFGILGSDGNIYACPHYSNQVLQVNVEDQTSNLVGPDLGDIIYKWSGFVEGFDGLLYGIPYFSKSLLRFDPVDKSAGLIPLNESLFENFPFKWFSGVRGKNGVIYAPPLNGNQALAILTSYQLESNSSDT